MAILLGKLKDQGWSNLFLQGDTQQKFGPPKVCEFYTNSSESGSTFVTNV